MAIASRQSPPEADSSTPSYPSSSAAVFKRLHPAQYLSRFLAQGYRPDGRKSCGWRKVSVNTGTRSSLHSTVAGRRTPVCLLTGLTVSGRLDIDGGRLGARQDGGHDDGLRDQSGGRSAGHGASRRGLPRYASLRLADIVMRSPTSNSGRETSYLTLTLASQCPTSISPRSAPPSSGPGPHRTRRRPSQTGCTISSSRPSPPRLPARPNLTVRHP